MASEKSRAAPGATSPSPQQPVAIVCIGMAGQSASMFTVKVISNTYVHNPGSGKTTFMQRINAHLHQKRDLPYVMNLDPAVLRVPFDCNIDIRDSVNYQEVMKQYNLGPNGGILTSLNLFATKVDQILALLEKRTAPDPSQPEKKPIRNILVDTREHGQAFP
jgi:GPN-loop GTPase